MAWNSILYFKAERATENYMGCLKAINLNTDDIDLTSVKKLSLLLAVLTKHK